MDRYFLLEFVFDLIWRRIAAVKEEKVGRVPTKSKSEEWNAASLRSAAWLSVAPTRACTKRPTNWNQKTQITQISQIMILKSKWKCHELQAFNAIYVLCIWNWRVMSSAFYIWKKNHRYGYNDWFTRRTFETIFISFASFNCSKSFSQMDTNS